MASLVTRALPVAALSDVRLATFAGRAVMPFEFIDDLSVCGLVLLEHRWTANQGQV